MDNFIKCKLNNYILGKRCPYCCKQFNLDDVIVYKETKRSDIEKIDFKLLNKKRTIKRGYNYYIHIRDYFLLGHLVYSPIRPRKKVDTICIETFCECGYYNLVEIDDNAI